MVINLPRRISSIMKKSARRTMEYKNLGRNNDQGKENWFIQL